jgi:hypothetical protein
MAFQAGHYPHLLLSLYIIRFQSDALSWHRAHLYREAITQNSPGSDPRAPPREIVAKSHPGEPNRLATGRIVRAPETSLTRN